MVCLCLQGCVCAFPQSKREREESRVRSGSQRRCTKHPLRSRCGDCNIRRRSSSSVRGPGKLFSEVYTPSRVIFVQQEKSRGNGSVRGIYARDSCLFLFSANSFAYQKGKGTLKALQKIKEYVNDGNVYVGKIDIKDYFENINHSILMSKLRKYQIEDKVLFLINKFIQCRVEDNFITREKTNGILQGCPLSSLLCNIYLTYMI